MVEDCRPGQLLQQKRLFLRERTGDAHVSLLHVLLLESFPHFRRMILGAAEESFELLRDASGQSDGVHQFNCSAGNASVSVVIAKF